MSRRPLSSELSNIVQQLVQLEESIKSRNVNAKDGNEKRNQLKTAVLQQMEQENIDFVHESGVYITRSETIKPFPLNYNCIRSCLQEFLQLPENHKGNPKELSERFIRFLDQKRSDSANVTKSQSLKISKKPPKMKIKSMVF